MHFANLTSHATKGNYNVDSLHAMLILQCDINAGDLLKSAV